jgi:aldehyde:ferredoxin oxidoreductase
MLVALTGPAQRVNNDQSPINQEQLDRYDPETFINTYQDGKTSCYRCPVGCSQKWKIEEGPYKGEKGDKIEFGHLLSLGLQLGIYDYPSMLHLAELTNRLGMDCIQFGWNISMVMECFQRGILGREDTDGLELKWGDVDAVAEMITRTAKREGFGNILAESIPEMIKRLGPEAQPYGFHTKGMSFPYPAMELTPMSLATAVGVRGADHLKGHPFSALVGNRDMLEKIFGKEIPDEIADPTSPVAKGRVVWWHENYKMLLDSLGLCFIPVSATNIYGDPLLLFEELGELYQAVTGEDPERLFKSTERAYQLEKSYNALLGISRKNDQRQGTIRERKDPISHPGMLDEYYSYRGCSQNGLPTRKRLLEVGLSDVVEDLAKKGAISGRECPAIEELVALPCSTTK